MAARQIYGQSVLSHDELSTALASNNHGGAGFGATGCVNACLSLEYLIFILGNGAWYLVWDGVA